MNIFYKLIGRLPVPVDDTIDWARWYETADRCVALDEVGPLRVSTIFLGIDHGFGMTGLPVLFETMVFGSKSDDEFSEGYQDRYRTWDEAEQGHARAVAWARERLAQADVALAPNPKSEAPK